MRQPQSRNGIRNSRLAFTMFVLAVLITTCATFARGQGAPMGDAVLPTVRHDATTELSMKINESFTFAAVGDIIVRRPMGQLDDPGFQALVKVMRSADMTYANMEGPIIDETDPNYRGPNVGGPRSIVDDLKAMGIRVMTTANNHTMDGGDAGMFMTNRLLDAAGITHAGSGKDLADARHDFDPRARMKRQVDQLVNYTQGVIRTSELRRYAYWAKADTSCAVL